jgi:hypothetical protein
MENRLFRQKSIDRVSSPEQLQDYICVTNPSVWIVLAAVIILLGGILIASFTGTLESTVTVTARIESGTATFEVMGKAAEELKEGMTLRIRDRETQIADVNWIAYDIAEATASVDLPDGQYEAVVVTEVISPIRFLAN